VGRDIGADGVWRLSAALGRHVQVLNLEKNGIDDVPGGALKDLLFALKWGFFAKM